MSPSNSKKRSYTQGKNNLDFPVEISGNLTTHGDKSRLKHDLKRYSAARAARTSIGNFGQNSSGLYSLKGRVL